MLSEYVVRIQRKRVLLGLIIDNSEFFLRSGPRSVHSWRLACLRCLVPGKSHVTLCGLDKPLLSALTNF